ncbi:RNA polymerase sigma factor [Stieleria marina]|uniref:RNA polymerase sigma factor n=1 Tax=Stieleria marina TaxID=1930275 RepID=UPI003AF3DFD2
MDPSISDYTTRPSLLLRMRDARDQGAWAEFTAIYEPVIYRMIKRRGVQDADAREIIQEVLMSVVGAIDRFDVDGNGSFRGWLSRITRNATVDRLRMLRRFETSNDSGIERAIDAAAEHLLPEDVLCQEFDTQYRQQLFRWAASQVRTRTGELNWIAFWKTSVEGQSIAKVAKELDISEGAIYVARCRILKRIRELVHQRLED